MIYPQLEHYCSPVLMNIPTDLEKILFGELKCGLIIGPEGGSFEVTCSQ